MTYQINDDEFTLRVSFSQDEVKIQTFLSDNANTSYPTGILWIPNKFLSDLIDLLSKKKFD